MSTKTALWRYPAKDTDYLRRDIEDEKISHDHK